MSKKKQYVIDENRQSFIYGDKKQEIEGCVNRGISEKAANSIYDSMNDFAKYAFNKSHSACYAVLTMQTAYLKYYYPVEFMAALLTSFMDSSTKIPEYILVCREMGIEILPPDINEGYSDFTAFGERSIRYGMSAVKGLGRAVIGTIVRDREQNGRYRDIRDFIERTSGKEVNKRAVENLIKAGALDSLPGNRRQKIIAYPMLMEDAAREKKDNIAGQMSLFELMGDDGEAAASVFSLPDVEELPDDTRLSYEKEVLGVYISGHPLQSYEALWKKNITKKTTDFLRDEEGNEPNVTEGAAETVGGIISEITERRTKKGDTFVIIMIEDLVGSMQVFVWPDLYRKYKDQLAMDQKIFVTGRVRLEDERDGYLSAGDIVPFDDMPVKLYIRFQNKDEYEDNNKKLMSILNSVDEGRDSVIVYLKQTKQQKKLTVNNRLRCSFAFEKRVRRR